MIHPAWCATPNHSGPWAGSREINGKLVYFAGTACYYEGRCVCEPATTSEASREVADARGGVR